MIPVLAGKATRIDRSVLPDDLLELADRQYRACVVEVQEIPVRTIMVV